MFSRLAHWLQPLLLILAILAIAWYIRSEWAALAAYPWRLDGAWLAAATALLFVSWALELEIWRRLLAGVGGELTFLQATRLWFLSAVVRYVPGSVWQPLSLTLYCRRYGIAVEATVASIVLYQVIIVLATAPLALFYLLWSSNDPAGQTMVGRMLLLDFTGQAPIWAALLLLAPVGLFLLRPQWLFRLLDWTLARVGRPPLQAHLTSGALVALVAAAVVDWLLWGTTFAAFTFAVAGGAAERAALAPYLITAYPIAITVGLLSLIAPSGIGAREGALLLLLAPRLEGAVVTVVALAMRLWTACGELIIALLSAPAERAQADLPAPDYAAVEPRPAETTLRREPT
ncbi:MAG TPA: lysylphosphatidylglycerol synthase domain-containing protein [Caldilineaceae bacterium]|nr:lysylphosphatidylglycerol synthase domain-containing protein [Caldilineaceae bacterium]